MEVSEVFVFTFLKQLQICFERFVDAVLWRHAVHWFDSLSLCLCFLQILFACPRCFFFQLLWLLCRTGGMYAAVVIGIISHVPKEHATFVICIRQF